MKAQLKNSLFVIIVVSLVVCTGCPVAEFDFKPKGTWTPVKVSNDTNGDEVVTTDWQLPDFEIVFEGSNYTINNVAPGYEALWTTDPTLFSSNEKGLFSTGTFEYEEVIEIIRFKESSGGSFVVEINGIPTNETDNLILYVTPILNVSAGRTESLANSWVFEMTN